MKRREMKVAFYDLWLNSSTRSKGVESASCASIAEVLDAIFKAIKKHGSPRYPVGETVLVDVMQMLYDSRFAEYHLLINRADSDLPDIALKDLRSKRLRFAGKTVTEGVDISTHIILRPDPHNPRSALMLVTQGGSLGTALLERLFTALSKLASDLGVNPSIFEFDHPEAAEGKKYNVRYSFTCAGHKSTTLARDLANGEFLEMELVRHQVQNFDQGGNFFIESSSISVKPKDGSTTTLGQLKQAVRDLLADPRNKFDTARVRFKDHSNKQRNESFDVNDLDAAFVKREHLKFDTDIQSNYVTVNGDIISKMRSVM